MWPCWPRREKPPGTKIQDPNFTRFARHRDRMKKDWNIVVIGAGIFGLTTALELVLQGYRNVTILDRHVPPVGEESTLMNHILLT